MQSEEITQEPAVLPRVLGSFDAAMIVVGSVIGSGIFLKPHTLAEALPNFGPIVAVWIGVGLITLCGCLSLAELAAMLPQAGGPYVYLREAYGKLPAFLWAWTEFWVVRTGSIGALAVATAIYLAEVTPLGRTGQEVVAIVLVVGLSAINYVSTRWTAHVQNFTTVLKVAFLGLIIVLPFLLGKTDAELLQPMFPPAIDKSLWAGLAAAVVAVLWAYDGWINIGPVVEEVRDPQRNVPRALAWGITLIMAIYVAATFAYHLVLPHSEIAANDAPTTALFAKLFSPEAARWVSLGVMLSAFGAVNSNMLTGPRIYFAVARDGLLPHFMQKVHRRYETPHNAVLVQCVWTILLIVAVFHFDETKLPDKAFEDLTNFVVFGGYMFYALAVSAVFTLRVKRPDLPRPYRTFGYPFVPGAFLLAFGAFVVSMAVTSPKASLTGLLLIAAGVPSFYWMLSGREARSRSR